MGTKLSYEEIQKRFTDKGFVLLSETYENSKRKLEYRCKCGQVASITIDHLRDGKNACHKCAQEKSKQTFIDHYGTDHPMKTEAVREKIKQTCIERYGTEYPMRTEAVQEKRKQTCMDLYGVNNPSKTEAVQEKRKQTCTDLYGSDHPMKNENVQEKFKQTCTDLYGVNHPMKTQAVQEKIKQTCIDLYNVDNPMKVGEFFNKCQSYKRKDYVMPSGEVVQYQGYEHLALDILLQTYTEDQVFIGDTKNIPVISYEFEGTSHKFYPDIRVHTKEGDKIIEVKSTWTYNLQKEKNDAKFKASVEKGCDIEFWIFDNHKTIVQKLKAEVPGH